MDRRRNNANIDERPMYSPNLNQNTFTLIELLLIIAIIGLLTAIALPWYAGYRDSARQATIIHDLRICLSETAVDIYQDGPLLTMPHWRVRGFHLLKCSRMEYSSTRSTVKFLCVNSYLVKVKKPSDGFTLIN